MMKRYIYMFVSVVFAASCIEDLSQYDYKDTNKVTFLSMMEGYTFTVGEEAEIVAPIEFSKPFDKEEDIDKTFDIGWYVDGERIAEGYRINYSFPTVGGFSMILKVIERTTGVTYLSENYSVESKSMIGWGWMLLSDFGDNESSLSFIAPVSMTPSYNLEKLFGMTEPFGTGPKGLDYYYVRGSINGSYISGLPKIILNQSSGTVTLDGRNLQPDKMMRDEFEGAAEPESDFTMTGFAFKGNYYLISTQEGNVYVRAMHRDYAEIPYYGTYSSMPYAFEGGAHISCFQGFQNVTYWTANEEATLVYDGLNARFITFVAGDYFGYDYATYAPKPVYLSFYDETVEFDPSVPKVNDLGVGTKCLAAGAYEVVGSDDSGYGVSFMPRYVALLDLGGSGNYQIYQFAVSPMGAKEHRIVENTMDPFSGASLLTENSVIRMSTNFEKNPYFYFTDGDRKLYVYSMATKSHALLYTADARITHLCSSPIVCEFKEYGGNNEQPNFRMAVGQENGSVAIVDVSKSKMVKVFEGASPDLEIKVLSGFGDIKDIVWATNYEGEY